MIAKFSDRQEPIQDRSKASVEKILTTAAALLDEVGLEGFNTNLLAERAEVRVRTIYRYFPNKYAVIVALTERIAAQWEEWTSELFEHVSDPREDWKLAMRKSRLKWLSEARATPGALSVLKALNATPELAALHWKIFEEMSANLSCALEKRGAAAPLAKRLAVARAVVNSLNSAVDVYLQLEGEEATAFLEEVSAMEESYLEKYLPAVRL